MTANSVPFVKMHGLGNDYVYIDAREVEIPRPESWAPVLADRHRGVGGDGLIVLRPHPEHPCRMEMFNADGSRAEMCGNGIRCVARLAWERGYAPAREFAIATDSGLKAVRVHAADRRPDDPEVLVTVAMGVAEIEPEDVELEAAGEHFRGTVVDLGNPHFIIEVEDPAAVPLERVGPELETNPRFPNRTNVEFVTLRGDRELDFRVWERGSGETRACGTGATAAAAALHHRGRVADEVTVHLLGGDLDIRIDGDGQTWMTGPAEHSFSGTFPRAWVESASS